jgi:hypothetical protein
MRLIRPSDVTTVMKRNYVVYRYARRIGEYDDDGTRLLKAVSGDKATATMPVSMRACGALETCFVGQALDKFYA